MSRTVLSTALALLVFTPLVGMAEMPHGGGGRGGGFGGHGGGFSGRMGGGFVGNGAVSVTYEGSVSGFSRSPGVSYRSVPSNITAMPSRSGNVGRVESFGRTGGSGRVGINLGIPFEVSRGWDRGGRHYWNHRYYGWSDEGWVVVETEPGIASYSVDEVEAAPEPTPAPVVNNAPAENGGTLVFQVQRLLNERGYEAGPADGSLGPQTRDAIATFQQDQGLPATGRISLGLLEALGIR